MILLVGDARSYLIRQFETAWKLAGFHLDGLRHVGFWWSTVLDHSFGDETLSREQVMWPGTADGVREWLGGLQGRWRVVLEQVTDDGLRSAERTRWPFQDRPFGDVVAWVNVELTKNTAEIGYARFLYAVRSPH